MTYPTASPPAVLGTSPAATGAAATPTGAAPTTPAGAPAAGENTAAASPLPTSVPSAWGNTTGITPYTPGTNGAGLPSMSLSAAVLAVAGIAAGAFLL